VLVWRILEACNLDCPFCDYRVSHAFRRARTDAGEIRRFADLLRQYGERSVTDVLVSWLGGEPFVYRDVLRLSRELAELPRLKLGATTNGSRLHDQELRAAVVETFSELTVSVDGLGVTHDHVRRKPGLYGRIREGIAALAAARRLGGRLSTLRVNTILHAENLDEFPDLVRDLAEAGATELSFNQLIGQPDDPVYRRLGLSLDAFRAFREGLPALRAEAAALGLAIVGRASYLDRVEAYLAGVAVPVTGCKATAPTLFVDEQGWIGPCSFTTRSAGVPLSQLRTADDFAGFLAGLDARVAAAAPAECRDCMDPNTFGKFAR
jgi:MoaA/NifB/PqqE/SkfB family radical SAM enzyme